LGPSIEDRLKVNLVETTTKYEKGPLTMKPVESFYTIKSHLKIAAPESSQLLSMPRMKVLLITLLLKCTAN